MLGTILTIGGSLLGAWSSYQAGKAQQSYLEKSAKAAEADAAAQTKASETAAKLLRERGARLVRDEGIAGRRLISSQRAGYAKAGVRLVGTPAEVITQTIADVDRTVAETSRDIEADALAILELGTTEASRALSLASQYSDQAGYALAAGYAQSGATLLTGLSRWEMSQRDYRLEG